MGRPSDFLPEYAEQARKLCLLGATDRELGDFFGVSEVTINAWKKARPEFLKSIKAGKQLANAEVATRLYERALGYSHRAVKIFPATKDHDVQQVEFTEHYPPDATAAIFFLKNRQPDKWRDKQQLEHTGKDGAPLLAEQMSAEDLKRLAIARGLIGAKAEKPKS